ncbi:hypothetical protein JXQ70_16200 [bacterium]|nr:hypothetical protein [bacterium]
MNKTRVIVRHGWQCFSLVLVGLVGILSVLAFPVTVNCAPSECFVPGQSMFKDLRPLGNERVPAGFEIARKFQSRDYRVNTYGVSRQENASLARLASGNIVVVWESRCQQKGSYGVYGRLFSPSGQALSAEIPLNIYDVGMQRFPVVAADPRDGFWVAWNSYGQDGDGWGIVARRFSSDLDQGSPEIMVNSRTAGQQSFASLAVSPAGEVLFCWLDSSPGDKPRLVTRLMNEKGEFANPELITEQKNPGTSDRTPKVIWQPRPGDNTSGRFLVVWVRTDPTQTASSILARSFDRSGRPHDQIIRIAGADQREHIEPSLAVNKAGQTVICWLSSNAAGYDLSACWYDADGRPFGPTWSHRSAGDEFYSGLTVDLTDDNRTLLAFNRTRENDLDTDILGFVLEHPCSKVASDPVALTDQLKGSQRLTIARAGQTLLWESPDRIVVAWSGDARLGDRSGVHLSVLASGKQEAPATINPISLAPAPREAGLISSPDVAAQTHLPPVFDPNWRPLTRLKGLRGDGPDYGFEAVSGTSWTPPDPELAVGPNHIVVIVNGQIAFFDKAGTSLFSQPIENAGGFWGPVGATYFVFDPEVLYDPHAQRFWAMANERSNDNKSMFLLAVSDDSDPTGTWYKWRFDVTALAGNDTDSPNMAVNSEAVFITADFFTPNDKYLIYILEKAPLLSGGSANVTSMLITGQQSFGLPITYDADMTTQYLIESTENYATSNTIVRFHALRNVLTTPTRQTYDLTVEPYRYAGEPPQKGTTYRPYLFEPRFWSCQYINGSLWATHHIRRVGQSETIARWYQFAMNGWPKSGQNPSLVQWGEVEFGTGIHTYFPSICADAQGNAALTFARSSSTEYISMWRALRRHDDPAGTFANRALVKDSFGPSYTDRWGDYSGTKQDPAQPNIFWGHHEWEDASSNWRTWVAKYDNSPDEVPALTLFGELALLLLLSTLVVLRKK